MPLSTKVDITKIGKLKKSGQGKNPIYLQKIRENKERTQAYSP